MRRALTNHISTLTRELRAQEAQYTPPQIERMYADIRTAATLAGRLPFKPVRMEHL